MDPKPAQIDEAPSIGDIVTAKDRVGQVDFSNRLVVEVEEDETPTQAAPADVSLRSTLATPADEAGEGEASGFPLILPPARVDAAMAAQVAEAKAAEDARLEAEAAAAAAEEAREQARQEERRQAAMDLKLARKRRKEEEVQAAAAAAAQRKAEKEAKSGKGTGAAGPAAVDPFPAASDDVSGDDLDDLDDLDAEAAGLVIEGPADLREVGAELAAIAAAEAEAAEMAAARETEGVEASRQHTRRTLHPEHVGEAPARAVRLPSTTGPADLGDLATQADDASGEIPADATVDAELAAPISADLAAVQSVQDVAASVIAAMQAAQNAHYLHLEALEDEAARRAELLTAQAELDAELIRLNGRREAHAIISAAQRRAGIEPELPDTDPLNEIGETFSRFAESIESTVADAIEIPDHLRKS